MLIDLRLLGAYQRRRLLHVVMMQARRLVILLAVLAGRRVSVRRLRLVVTGRRRLLARRLLVARVLADLRVVAEHGGHLVMARAGLLLLVVVGRVGVVVVRVGVVVRDGAHVSHGRCGGRVVLGRGRHRRRLVLGGLVRVPDGLVRLVPSRAVVVASVQDAQGVVDAAVLGGHSQRCGRRVAGRRACRHCAGRDRGRAGARVGANTCAAAAHLD